jgi:hypothetical protein
MRYRIKHNTVTNEFRVEYFESWLHWPWWSDVSGYQSSLESCHKFISNHSRQEKEAQKKTKREKLIANSWETLEGPGL